VIRRFKKVVCKFDEELLELPEELPVLLVAEVDKLAGCCTAAGIVAVIP
jgi:hypothetical protein